MFLKTQNISCIINETPLIMISGENFNILLNNFLTLIME